MLKWLGLWAMTVDHIGAIWFDYQTPITTLIGRMAFPIFAFLTGVNVLRSKNPERYTAYLLIAGILSQPFYIIAFGHQTGLPLNVLFTLGLGAAVATAQFRTPPDTWYWQPIFVLPGAILLSPYVEYGTIGIGLIVAVTFTAWCFRQDLWICLLPAGAATYMAWTVNGLIPAYGWIAGATLIFATIYTSSRVVPSGKAIDRWFFYTYYPLHMAVLLTISAVVF